MVAAVQEKPTYSYKRPWMYEKQEAAFFNTSRYSYIEASTKSGKSVGAIAWIFEQAIKGKSGYNYWWVSPIIAQAKIMYRRMKRGIPQQLYKPNDTELTITLANGSVIWFKGSDNPDSLYGEDVYAAVIDEASRCKEDAFTAVRTTLTATLGPLRCIGNVRGKNNWFYRECRRAEAGDYRNAEFHRITAEDAVAAGVFPKEELDDAKVVFARTPDKFDQLYNAIAADDGNNPFGEEAIDACIRSLSNKPPQAFGIDLAKSVDWTVIIGLDEDRNVCHFDRFQRPWKSTVETIVNTIGRVPTLIDSTGVGDPIVEQVQDKIDTDTVEGIVFTPKSKQQLMDGLGLAISEGTVGFPSGPIVDELKSLEYTHTRTGIRYEAPSGLHDDCVMSLALGVSQLRRPTSAFFMDWV